MSKTHADDGRSTSGLKRPLEDTLKKQPVRDSLDMSAMVAALALSPRRPKLPGKENAAAALRPEQPSLEDLRLEQEMDGILGKAADLPIARKLDFLNPAAAAAEMVVAFPRIQEVQPMEVQEPRDEMPRRQKRAAEIEASPGQAKLMEPQEHKEMPKISKRAAELPSPNLPSLNIEQASVEHTKKRGRF